MTIVGTVRANSKGFPKEITRGDKEKFSNRFFYNSPKNCMLVNYHCKQKKNVNLLSTMPSSPGTDATENKKPLVVHFYNQNKVGVYVFDQMARKYSTHAAIETMAFDCLDKSIGHSCTKLLDFVQTMFW